MWLGISLALKLYYQMMPNANAAYGTIGGVMVLMLWFYVSGLALLLGAELNAEIEHASPYGKDPGERVPGEKRVVGPRAQRLYEEKKAKGEMPIKPIPTASTATSIGRRGAAAREREAERPDHRHAGAGLDGAGRRPESPRRVQEMGVVGIGDQVCRVEDPIPDPRSPIPD